MEFGIPTFAAIVVFCYLIGMAAKNIKQISDEWIPVICGASGGVLGLVGLLTQTPDFPATDGLTAIAVGIVSGLASVGIHQISKQLSKR